MISIANAESNIRAGIRAMEKARAQEQWREFVKHLNQLTPTLNEVSRAVETSWFELPPKLQSDLIKFRELVLRSQNEIREYYRRRSFFDRLAFAFNVGYFALTESDLWSPALAQAKLLVAIGNALSKEWRRRDAMADAMKTDPEMLATIQRGEEDFKAGRTTRYTYEEFEKRLNSI